MTVPWNVLLHRVTVDGALMSAIATALILLSVRANPRLWLQDFPQDIRDAVPPKTADEKRQSLVWGIPFLVTFVGVPVWSCVELSRQLASHASFALLWLDAFGVILVFNVVDLVLIDWLVVCWMTPGFIVIPGTAGFAGYKNYGHHARGFLIGLLGAAVAATLVAAAVYARMR